MEKFSPRLDGNNEKFRGLGIQLEELVTFWQEYENHVPRGVNFDEESQWQNEVYDKLQEEFRALSVILNDRNRKTPPSEEIEKLKVRLDNFRREVGKAYKDILSSQSKSDFAA
ncbi:hypothetical protein HYW32_03560 [Candidatus Berkelbacteria bacterium]|nr:hypothetical protein [Candidatus Berkelbacteria bacterium]